MDHGQRPPLQGGIKVVFDVPNGDVERVLETLGQNGFDARRYYRLSDTPTRGVPAGSTRVGAEKAKRFDGRGFSQVQGAFEQIRDLHSLPVTIVAIEEWTAH